MAYHSLKEVIKDITDFEKVDPNFSQEIMQSPVCFIKLYSQVHAKPLPKQKASGIKERINAYVKRYCVPPLECEADEGAMYTLYGGTSTDTPFTKLGSYEDFEDFQDRLGDDMERFEHLYSWYVMINTVADEVSLMRKEVN
jgi:hypothetical protein